MKAELVPTFQRVLFLGLFGFLQLVQAIFPSLREPPVLMLRCIFRGSSRDRCRDFLRRRIHTLDPFSLHPDVVRSSHRSVARGIFTSQV